MTTFRSENFEELVQQCVVSDYKHRMLYVFVRVGAIEGAGEDLEVDEEAVMVQVLFDAHQPAVHGMDFEALRKTADAQDPSWNMVVVGRVKSEDASLPSEAEAQAFLADMREKIMIGAIDGYALLDRDGMAIDMSVEVEPTISATALN